VHACVAFLRGAVDMYVS